MTPPSVALGNIATIEREGIDASAIPAGTRYVGLENIESGGHSVNFALVEAGQIASTKFRFSSEHVLFGKLRPYLAKIVRPSFDGVCSTDILPIRPGPKLDRGYLTQFLLQPKTVDWAASRATGVNLPRLSPKQLECLEIPLPPLDEQRRIAAILDKADALRRKRKRALELLDGLTQSIFLEMFGRPGNENSRLPQKRLGDLAELINGDRSSNYPSGSDLVSDGVLFLNTTNISPSGLDLSQANFIAKEKFDSLTRGKLRRRDIVITLRGSLGQSAIFDCGADTAFINAQMMIIRPKLGLDPIYLLQALQLDQMRKHLKAIGSGSAVPQLTAKQMSDLLIALPGADEQAAFASKRRECTLASSLLKNAEASSQSFFASLQHRAFSGQL